MIKVYTPNSREDLLVRFGLVGKEGICFCEWVVFRFLVVVKIERGRWAAEVGDLGGSGVL